MVPVKFLTIHAEQAGQRIDNFLLRYFKGLPKSRIYRALRKGEVRVNKGRIKPTYRLQINDELRLPPLALPDPQKLPNPSERWIKILKECVVYEDDQLLLLDKPSGMAVHAGSQVPMGLIEWLRLMRGEDKTLELVHRIDRDTSGCLLIAKHRQSLLALHDLMVSRTLKKQYLTLVKGRWPDGECVVDAPLQKNQLQSGERMVVVDDTQGKPAQTRFRPLHFYKEATLLEAFPISGRTHQIRVHAAYKGYPIVGDPKYGDKIFNQKMRDLGLKRLFLHAASVQSELTPAICVVLPLELQEMIKKLKN